MDGPLSALAAARQGLRSALAEPSGSILLLPPGDDLRDIVDAMDGGTWWLLPLFRHKEGYYGVRLSPASAETTGPILVCTEGATVTWCTSAARLLDRTLCSIAGRNQKTWSRMRTDWPRWQSLSDSAQAAVLPGSSVTFASLLFDDAWFPSGGEGDATPHDLPGMVAALDPAPETHAFAEGIRRHHRGESIALNANVGPWRARYLCLSRLPSGLLTPDAAQSLLGEAFGADICMAGAPELRWPLHRFDLTMGAYAIGRALFGFAPAGSPMPAELDHPLGRALAQYWKAYKESRPYDGLAHMVAAAGLEQEGRFDLAWNALMSASFFATGYAGTCPIAIFKAALSMAERNALPVAPILREMWQIYLSVKPTTDQSGVER